LQRGRRFIDLNRRALENFRHPGRTAAKKDKKKKKEVDRRTRAQKKKNKNGGGKCFFQRKKVKGGKGADEGRWVTGPDYAFWGMLSGSQKQMCEEKPKIGS